MSKIFVGNLSWNTTDNVLHAAFSPHGHIVDAVVIEDRKTGRSHGFGFVTFATETEADRAMHTMNGVDLDGRKIRVELAYTKLAGGSHGDGQADYGDGYADYAGPQESNDSNIPPRTISDPYPYLLVRTDYNSTQVMKATSAGFVDDDESSEASSNGPGGSVFSIACHGSISSAVTELLQSSAYSMEQIEIATANLSSMLQDDEVLISLYIVAIRNDSIGPQRLERNLRRLLKLYSEHLKEEAHDSLEHLAARLVSVKAMSLAKSVVEKYKDDSNTRSVGIEVHERTDTDVEDGPEADEEESVTDGDPTTYGDVLEDFAKVREFLRGSDSFQTLRMQLQDFVNRNKSDITEPPLSASSEYAFS
jgi:hypothetical protein